MPRKAKARGASDGPALAAADPDQLYTVEQTAGLLAISDWKVREQIQRSRLPAVFIEGMTRIRAADIREYIASRRHNPADDLLSVS
jgi:excisionase family DNA binding protein